MLYPYKNEKITRANALPFQEYRMNCCGFVHSHCIRDISQTSRKTRTKLTSRVRCWKREIVNIISNFLSRHPVLYYQFNTHVSGVIIKCQITCLYDIFHSYARHCTRLRLCKSWATLGAQKWETPPFVRTRIRIPLWNRKMSLRQFFQRSYLLHSKQNNVSFIEREEPLAKKFNSNLSIIE